MFNFQAANRRSFVGRQYQAADTLIGFSLDKAPSEIRHRVPFPARCGNLLMFRVAESVSQ
jgi:hypothetical protein